MIRVGGGDAKSIDTPIEGGLVDIPEGGILLQCFYWVGDAGCRHKVPNIARV